MSIIKLQSESDLKLGQYYEFDPEDKSMILGKGGMGIVFRGKLVYVETGKYDDVAIKVLFRDLAEESVMRAKREASIQIVHENIIRMYGFIETLDGEKPKYHVISEYLEGESLSDIIKKKSKFSNSEALKIVKNILFGLGMLHQKGFVHRDIDPSNIIICKNGNIKLIDFGIAKQIKEYRDEYSHVTQDGRFIGKPNYASPEQAKGEHWFTNAISDIYSVGILLFELLTGKLPYSGATYQIIQGHLKEPIPIKEIEDDYLRYVVKKATEKDQKNRYQSASDFIVDIEKIEKNIDPRTPLFYKSWYFRSAAVAIVGLITFLIISLSNGNTEKYTISLKVANESLSIAMYDSALIQFKEAYALKSIDSISLKIKMLETLTKAVKYYQISDYSKADSLFLKAAELHSSDAYYYLGEMCYEGIGRPKDFKKGFEYTSAAEKMGNKLAAYRLGLIYQRGLDLKADNDKAIHYFEIAGRTIDRGIELNNPESEYLKGLMYKDGYGVMKNEQKAIEYFEMAANQNYPGAQYELYDIQYASNHQEALKWLSKSADNGYPKAQYELGRLLIDQQDYEIAVGWIKKAANKNFSPALRLMGAILQDPSKNTKAMTIQNITGLTGNDSISNFYSQRAVDYDFDNYNAMIDLAYDYENGKGVEKDIAKANKYYQMANNRKALNQK